MRNVLSLLVPLLLAATSALAVPGQPLTPWIRQVDAFDKGKIAAHPRLLLTPSEQVRVRAAAKTPEGKPYWDFVREATLKYRADALLPDPAGFPDGKWNVEDWRRIVDAGGNLQNRILSTAFAWVITQDPADLDEAKRWALNAAAWDPNGPSGIEGVDHPAHDVLHALCLSYDWLYSEWTPAERLKVEECIAARGKALYQHLKPYRYDSWNNHPWFQTTALAEAGLALADKSSEADSWWRYASNLYFTEFLPLGGRDGDWHEGTHYVAYTLIFVYQWADALLTATGINAYRVPWLNDVGLFRLYTAPPTGGGIHFNDNNVKAPNHWDRMTAYNAAMHTRNPVLQWYAETMRPPEKLNVIPALMTLVYRDALLVPQPPAVDTPLGRWFRDSGWVVFRTDLSTSDDIQFGLKAGPYLSAPGNRGHDHPDQNSFLINYLTEPLVVDSGYYDWYGSPHHYGWSFTAEAHNTIVVDGKSQNVATQGADGKVVHFVSHNGGMRFVESEAAAAYPKGVLKSWRRQVLFIPPDTFVVRDIVKPEKPSSIEWLLHGPNEFAIDGQAFTVTNKNAALAGNILGPQDLKLTQWGGFPENAIPERKTPGVYPDQWHLKASTPDKVGDTILTTILRVGKDGVRVPDTYTQEDDPGLMTLETESGPAELLYVDGPQPAKKDQAFVAARLAAFQGSRGGSALLAGATHVAIGGNLIWASHRPADVSGLVGLSDRWTDLNIRLDESGKVRFAVNRKPASVLVNGKSGRFEYDPKTRTVALTLSEGYSEVKVQ